MEPYARLLARTPDVLDALLAGLPDAWAHADEGPGTWSPFDVVGHLAHGERTDWIPRARIVLAGGTFEPFDRAGRAGGDTLAERLRSFRLLRSESLAALRKFSPDDLGRRARHPALGEVTLAELFGAWVAHDLAHLAQIARVLARRFDVGPWIAYFSFLS